MVTKARAHKETKATKADYISLIRRKMNRVKPAIADPFLRRLKYKTKAELRRMATRMRVEADRGGFDITYR